MRVEWKTVSLIVLVYLAWAASGMWLWPHFPALAVIAMALAATLHASLVHECIHGHPTRKRWLNEVLVAANLSLVWPYRRFRTLHLRHHHDTHLTDPFEDPESFYKARWQLHEMPTWFQIVLRINNTMVGRVVLGPLLGTWGLVTGDLRQIFSGNRIILKDWLVHLLATTPVVLLVTMVFEIPFWAYLIGVAWPALGLVSVRTFAEHRWFESVEGRSIIVEHTPLSFLFLNNNLHIVHHSYPAAPWYELPRLFKASRQEWITRNQGYVYRNYGQLWRAYAFRPKESVAHPALQNEPLDREQVKAH